MKFLLFLFAAAIIASGSSFAQDATSSPSPSPSPKKTHRHRAAAQTSPTPATPSVTGSQGPPVTSATPATGGGNGQVWVNSSTHVYHKEGSRFYGKTKHGKYMSEQDAIKEGDHAAKNEH
jgi:hypothetical protein